MTNSITVVIPTRNRPDDMKKAVASIVKQDRLPEELIIVDQSEGDDTFNIVRSLFKKENNIDLVYVHDPNITGLVEAKRVASEKAVGDIVCFLEDDIILESSYIRQIEKGFNENNEVLGCSGIITNIPNQSSLYRLMHALFFQGIFKDPRPQVFGNYDDSSHGLVLSDVLSGGLSAWRRHVLSTVPFDVENGFFMLEDIDYSTRVVKKYGHVLYINKAARLEHHYSSVNRDPHGYRQRRKLTEGILFFKKRRDWPGAKRGLVFVMIWWFSEAVFQSVRGRTIDPFLGYWCGLFDGVTKKLV